MEDHQEGNDKKKIQSKRTYFADEHIFVLAGHGTEIVRPGLRNRFELNEGEYCAISNSVGEVGILYPEYITTFFENSDNKIKIPYDDTITNDPKLGFIDTVKRRNEFDPEEKYVDIDYFKLYRPRIDDKNNRVYKYTVPNLNYYPTAFFFDSVEFFKDEGMGNNVYYKDVSYRNVNLLTLKMDHSGIIPRTYTVEDASFDLSNIYGAFKSFRKNILLLGYDTVTKYNNRPFYYSYNNDSRVFITVPQHAFDTPISKIIANRKRDPLAYDFLQFTIESYSKSILTFDEVCLHCICKRAIELQRKKTPIVSKIAKEIFKLFGKFWESKSVREGKIISSSDLTDELFLNYIKNNKMYEKPQKEILYSVTIGDMIETYMKMDTVFKFINLKVKYDKSNPLLVIPILCRSINKEFPSSEKTVKKYRALSRPAATKKKTKTPTVKSKTIKRTKSKN